MAQKTLSIIIPFYKTYDLTTRLLDQLVPQLTDEVEVILVDDGCNEERLDKYPIQVIHKRNEGVSKARNTALDICAGDYIAFIDSDDYIPDYYIHKILTKIKTSDFDYCLMSWQATGKNTETIIIQDIPPKWNTCIWNCIYKRSAIGGYRFDENKTIGEDLLFNKKVRKGKKENIIDIMYYYYSGRPDSLVSRYRSGEIAMGETIKAQLIIYRSYLSKLGGIETAIYNACNNLKDKYDIIFIYDTADEYQIARLRKLVNCLKFVGQKFVCDTFIAYGFNPEIVYANVIANKFVQQICCDCEVLDFRYPAKNPKITHFTSDSKASAKAFIKKNPEHTKMGCGVLHNLFDIPKGKRCLNLVTASRLSAEKGYERMKALAKRMNELKIPFEWTVFTNDKPNEEIDGFIFRTPRLNVIDYMSNKDYGLQLSNTDSWGCTITEFLENGIPAIVTDFASAYEQVQDGVNGFILKRDMSNLDEVITKMYESKLKFKYEPQYSIKEWTDLIGDLGGKEEDYIYTEPKGKEVEVLRLYTRNGITRMPSEQFYVDDDEELEYLLGNNAKKTPVVKIISGC